MLDSIRDYDPHREAFGPTPGGGGGVGGSQSGASARRRLSVGARLSFLKHERSAAVLCVKFSLHWRSSRHGATRTWNLVLGRCLRALVSGPPLSARRLARSTAARPGASSERRRRAGAHRFAMVRRSERSSSLEFADWPGRAPHRETARGRGCGRFRFRRSFSLNTILRSRRSPRDPLPLHRKSTSSLRRKGRCMGVGPQLFGVRALRLFTDGRSRHVHSRLLRSRTAELQARWRIVSLLEL